MKPRLFFLLFSLFATQCYAQKVGRGTLSFGERVRLNFEYDTLQKITCDSIPSGVYASWFTVNETGRPVYLGFSCDSLTIMRSLIENSIIRTFSQTENIYLEPNNTFCQFFYFNNVFCLEKDIDSKNLGEMSDDSFGVYAKETVKKMEMKRLSTIEKLLLEFQVKFTGATQILPFVFIDNNDPRKPKGKKTCTNDFSNMEKFRLTEEQREEIEAEVKKRKAKN